MRMRPFPILALLLAACTAMGADAPAGAVPPSLPAPWQLSNIGPEGMLGTAVFKSGVYTIGSAGEDIDNNDDKFTFVSQQGKSDESISARIVSQVNTHEWAKAGLMFRDGTSANTGFAMLAVTPGHGLIFAWRYGPGAGTGVKVLGPVTLPVWLKLEKRGTNYNAASSPDGQQWTPLVTHEIPAPFPGLHVGMAVTSHDPGKPSTVVFDKLRLN